MKILLDTIFYRRKLLLLLSGLVLAFGIYSYIIIPKQNMPTIETPYMAIQVIAPGVSASDLEDRAIDDMERVILTYQDVMEVNSTIYDNVGILYVLFSYDADDPNQLAEDIFIKLNELELDPTITELRYDNGFDDPHIIFSVYSDDVPMSTLESTAVAFKNELLTIDDIQTITIDNAYDENIIITLDADSLALHGLTITDIYQLLQASTLNIPLGGISTAYGTISVTGDASFDTIEDLNELINIPDIPTIVEEVTLADIATVTLVNTTNKIYTFDQEQAIFLTVYFNQDIDFTVLGDEVLDVKTDFLRTTSEDISISEMLFLPDYVNEQISTVFYSLLIAIGVVMVVVLIGIGFRNSLLIILTIPIIIFGTIGVLYLANHQLHKLTIVGLIVAIGIMVDNSIVVTESIKHHIDQGMTKLAAGKHAIRTNLTPILTSTLTTIAAFIVIVLLPGFLGNIVRSMPLTVIIAISLSFLVSMMFSPIVAILFLKPGKPKPNKGIHERRIRTMIRRTIKFPLIWILLAVGTLGLVTYLTFANQPIDLYPNDDRSILYIDFESTINGDISSTIDVRDEILSLIEDNDALVHTAASVGGSLPHFHFSAQRLSDLPQYGRVFVEFDLTEQETADLMEDLQVQLDTIEDATISIHLLELSPPEPPLTLQLTGKSLSNLSIVAAALETELEDIESIETFDSIGSISGVSYHVSYDQSAIRNNYLTQAEVDEVIATTLNGYRLEGVSIEDQPLDIMVSLGLTDITEMLTFTVYSSTLDRDVELSDLIDITPLQGYSVITKRNNDNVYRVELYPTANSSLRDMEDDVNAALDSINTTGVSITYGGENQLFEDISDDLIRAGVIAIIMIFIILFIQFNNFIKPLIVLLTIPLSFTGSFLFLLIFDIPITATALIGIVSLMGVTVNTGILLVEYISKNAETEGVEDACVNAVFQRFRAIILTSATTILGLIPLLISGGSFFQPLAITFMGGMVTSTLITIFLVPSVYTLFYRKKRA